MNIHYSIFSLYPYVALLLLFLITIKLKLPEHKKSNILFVSLCLFTVLRYNVGWDYDAYVDTILAGPEDPNFERTEPISRFVYYLAYKLNFYPFFFIVFGTAQLILFKKSIDRIGSNKHSPWLFYLLFPSLYLQDLCIARQALAVQVVLYSLILLRDKKYIYYLLGIFVAFNIHKTALIGLLAIPFAFFHFSNKLNWVLFIGSLFAGNILTSILAPFAQLGVISRFFSYTEMDGTQSSLMNWLLYGLNVIILISSNRLIKRDERNRYLIPLANLGMVVYNLFFFEPTTAGRICVYFVIAWTFLLPQIPNVWKLRRYNFVYVSFFVMLYFYYLIMYVNHYNSGVIEKPAYVPYELWINNL